MLYSGNFCSDSTEIVEWVDLNFEVCMNPYSRRPLAYGSYGWMNSFKRHNCPWQDCHFLSAWWGWSCFSFSLLTELSLWEVLCLLGSKDKKCHTMPKVKQFSSVFFIFNSKDKKCHKMPKVKQFSSLIHNRKKRKRDFQHISAEILLKREVE